MTSLPNELQTKLIKFLNKLIDYFPNIKSRPIIGLDIHNLSYNEHSITGYAIDNSVYNFELKFAGDVICLNNNTVFLKECKFYSDYLSYLEVLTAYLLYCKRNKYISNIKQ